MSEPGAIATGFFLPPVKVRQFVTLFVINVIARFPDALFRPKVTLASLVSPRCVFVEPQAVFSKLPRCVGFQSYQSIFRLFRSDANNYVNMVRPNLYSEKPPFAFSAKVSYCFLDGFSTSSIQCHWRMKQQIFAMLMPVAVCWNSGRSIDVVITVNRSTFVAVKPCSVTAKREENC